MTKSKLDRELDRVLEQTLSKAFEGHANRQQLYDRLVERVASSMSWSADYVHNYVHMAKVICQKDFKIKPPPMPQPKFRYLKGFRSYRDAKRWRDDVKEVLAAHKNARGYLCSLFDDTCDNTHIVNAHTRSCNLTRFLRALREHLGPYDARKGHPAFGTGNPHRNEDLSVDLRQAFLRRLLQEADDYIKLVEGT